MDSQRPGQDNRRYAELYRYEENVTYSEGVRGKENARYAEFTANISSAQKPATGKNASRKKKTTAKLVATLSNRNEYREYKLSSSGTASIEFNGLSEATEYVFAVRAASSGSVYFSQNVATATNLSMLSTKTAIYLSIPRNLNIL